MGTLDSGTGERGMERCLDIVGIYRILVVSPRQVDLREGVTTRELVGIIVNVTDGVAVGNGTGVQRSIVAAGIPTVVLFRHDMKRRGPGTLGAASRKLQVFFMNYSSTLTSVSKLIFVDR
jgi:hypothetical protein